MKKKFRNSGARPMQQQQRPPQQQKVNVPLDKLEDINCDCGCPTFIKIVTLKFLNKIVSPTGQEGIVPVEHLICQECKAPFDINEYQKKRIAKEKLQRDLLSSNVKADDTIGVKDTVEEEKSTDVLCRKCGTFYSNELSECPDCITDKEED